MLQSSFNGRPAPGGIFEASTRTYRKKLPSRAFYWPLRAYPVDEPIVQQLKELRCEVVVLEVIKSNGFKETYKVDFQNFLKKSSLVDWSQKGDHRFPVRRYLPLEFWQKSDDQEGQDDDMPPDIPF